MARLRDAVTAVNPPVIPDPPATVAAVADTRPAKPPARRGRQTTGLMTAPNPFRHGPATQEEALAEMFDVMQQVLVEQRQILAEQRQTNGRVTALERWQIEQTQAIANRHREVEAYERGVRDTLDRGPLLTKRQKALLATLFGGMATVAPVLGGLLERVFA